MPLLLQGLFTSCCHTIGRSLTKKPPLLPRSMSLGKRSQRGWELTMAAGLNLENYLEEKHGRCWCNMIDFFNAEVSLSLTSLYAGSSRIAIRRGLQSSVISNILPRSLILANFDSAAFSKRLLVFNLEHLSRVGTHRKFLIGAFRTNHDWRVILSAFDWMVLLASAYQASEAYITQERTIVRNKVTLVLCGRRLLPARSGQASQRWVTADVCACNEVTRNRT